MSRLPILALALLLGGCSDNAPGATAAALTNSTIAPKTAATTRVAHILFTAARHGQLEESGCSLMQFGGIARQVSWLATSPLAGAPEARLLLDGGDTWLPPLEQPPTDEQRARAALLATLYDELGYDAVALGPDDLALGEGALAQLASTHLFSVISGNTYPRDGDEAPFEQGLVYLVGGVRVGVFSLISPLYGEGAPREGRPWRFSPTLKAAKSLVKALRDRGAEVVVALAALRAKEIAPLIEEAGVDLVLHDACGVEDSPAPAPVESIAGGFAVCPGPNGEHIAVIDVELHPDATSPKLADGNRAARLRARVAAIDARIEKNMAKGKDARPAKIKRLRAERDKITLLSADVQPVPPHRHLLRVVYAPIDPTLPHDPGVDARVRRILNKPPREATP